MAKKAVQISQSIPPGQTMNVLAGKRFENVSSNGLITLAQTGSGEGLNSELFVGTQNALESSPVGGTNRVPQIPDDVVVDEVDALKGDKVQLNVQNGSVVALVYEAKLIHDDNVQII